MTTDIRGQLAALINHLNEHEHLAVTLNGVNSTIPDLAVQPYPFGRASNDRLPVLSDWARTLIGCTEVKVESVDEAGRVHLILRGQLVDGTPAEVWCLPRPAELDLLAAHTRLTDDATFSVELLLRLVDAPAADDKRTCAFPGDQEHDHAMCEDVVADEATAERAECPVDDPDCEAGAQLDPESYVCHDACEAPAAEAVTR